MMLGRIQSSIDTTFHYDLDKLFGNPLRFPRLVSESYSQNPATDLITAAEWDGIKIKDSMYRARIHDFMAAIAHGGTKEGIRLAARAAVGVDCMVLEAWRYYKSRGLDEDLSRTWPYQQTGQSHYLSDNVGYSDNHDYGDVVIYPLKTSVSEEEVRLIGLTVGRIAPRDTRVAVVPVDEIPYRVESSVVGASSSFSSVVRKVTGKHDWTFPVKNNMWIMSGVEREAPTQAFGTHQEDLFDFTSAVTLANSTSDHLGPYNASQESLFASLKGDVAKSRHIASDALSSHIRRRFSTSYVDGSMVVDDSYPVEYFSAVTENGVTTGTT
jgi:hypothetical protein